ncbi:importin subunit beta-3, partial [Jimgerdemannia flammicorona]
TWQDLLVVLFECTKSPSAELRESAFRILHSVPSLIADQNTDILKSVFSASLGDTSSKEVRTAALKAAVSYLCQADANSQKGFQELMPQMLNVLAPFLAERDQDSLFDGLTVLIELAENLPRSFRPVFGNVLTFMVTIIKETDLEDRTRQTSLELLLTLAESAPAMVRKQPEFCSQVIPLALEMMTDLEDEEKWYSTDDLDEDDDAENYVIGEHAMDRLARNLGIFFRFIAWIPSIVCVCHRLGGNSVLPISFRYIPTMLSSDKWQQRHAALMAISAIGEGCVKAMEAELGTIIQLVLPHFRDPHPRVRYATCNAIGQMSTDFAPNLQKKFHEMVLTHLIPVMDDNANPRVQAHAAAALVNFCENVDKTTLAPYLDTIFDRLHVLLNTSKVYVQEQAITTIATVADSAEDKFVKYHGVIMPLLLNVLRQATQKQYRLLRGKAMECASLIALAVGKKIFAPNAHEFIELLIQTQQSVTEADDPQISYLLACWARICKVLGNDFLPYLPIVIPPLLQSAQLKPDFAVLEDDVDAESKFSAEDGWEFVGVDGQQIGIKTTVLEEKCTAVEMLICYARELGAGFQPYVEQVMDIVMPLLKFYFHDGVRHAAACVVPLLIQSVQKANASTSVSELTYGYLFGYCGTIRAANTDPEYISKMWHSVCPKIIDVIMSEADPSFLSQLYMTFYESLETVGQNSMEPTEFEAFTKATESQLKEFYERLQQRAQARSSQEYDAEDEEGMQEEEATEEAVLGEVFIFLCFLDLHRTIVYCCLTPIIRLTWVATDEHYLMKLSKALHTILKTQGIAFLPYFDRLVPVIMTFFNDKDTAARQWAVCVFDDLIEFTGPASWAYQGQFLPKLVASLLDPATDVRQAAAYGLGVCGQFGGPNYADVCAAALNPLFQLINLPDSRAQENIFVTENAISAVSKICKFNNSKFDVNTVLPVWFAALPLTHDEEEAPVTYTYLLDLLDSQHPSIIGTNSENIPHLVSIFTDVLVAAILPEQLAQRMAVTLKAVLSGVPDAARQQLWNQLEPEKRQALQDLKYV